MALFVLLSASTRTKLISTNFSVFLLVFGNPEITHLLTTAFQLVNSARRDLINVNRTGANALQSVICIESEKSHHALVLVIGKKERSDVIEHLLVCLRVMQLVLKDEVGHVDRLSRARE